MEEISINLPQLGKKYGTDKYEHGFCEIYQDLFEKKRLSVERVLEIGVFFGSSIRMWKEYFCNATIYGMDHFLGLQGNGEMFQNASLFWDEMQKNPDPKIELVKIHQSKLGLIEEFVEKQISSGNLFDIIIDDASHTMSHQQQSLGFFFPLLKSGGCFIIEDLHTSMGNPGQYDIEMDRNNTTLFMLLDYQRDKKWRSCYLTKDKIDYMNQHTDKVFIREKRNSWGGTSMLGVVYKK